MNLPLSRIVPPLTYLNVASYCTPRGEVRDYSSVPRPHNCISLFYEGAANFYSDGKTVRVEKGTVVFVPWQSLYRSEFLGDPETKYLTIHCNFAPSEFVFSSADYSLQTIPVDLERMQENFSFLERNIGKTDFTALEVMQRLYAVLGELLPRLTKKRATPHDETILRAIDYMEEHFADELTCAELAEQAAMSESRFYMQFKKETGLTPVEYKNHIRIRRAIDLLFQDLSIEEVTTELGFNSSAYFRKVFKKSTGYNPHEYRKRFLER